MSEAPRASRGLLLAIAIVSAATLAVQILQTRLFSLMLWHHLTYMVVTVTLLGFAARCWRSSPESPGSEATPASRSPAAARSSAYRCSGPSRS
ncbi:MAG: hypothetical protein ACE5F1_10030 [Planctomycetota bacterium]